MEIKRIDFENNYYPSKLREITNPPKVLYVLGDETILNNQCLSIIGSRNCTEYGAEMAANFARDLAKMGITIVSGMAKGIDSCAHLGAIESQGKTIAVLGSGFKHIYPSKKVYKKILENGGAVITEYEENVEVFSQGFRDRNRIIAGISIGTLVIEAKEFSGTGITAEYVKKYGRELFCIPHLIGDKAGIGTNRLLKNGAKLVTKKEDIIKYFKNIEMVEKIEKKVVQKIPEEYKKIYEKIAYEPINVDELRKKLNMPISEVNTVLTMMELEGLIESRPGNCFKRKEN